MTLRTRLLIVLAVVLVTYAIAAVLVVSTQRQLLVEQVDSQLRSIPAGELFRITNPPPTSGEFPANGDMLVQELPFSDLYVGMIATDGQTTSVLVGSFSGGTPNLGDAVDATGGQPGLVTIGAENGASQFRAMVLPQPDGSGWLVAARPLDEIDAAIVRLERTLWIAGVVILAVLLLAYAWVQRLGLRPIGRVTAVAEAIAAGDHSRRVEVAGNRTEAGKLGSAFNLMLDERDADEARLRQFVADASHELRTPLTSVRGYLELYQQGGFRNDGQMDDVVRRLSAESTRMHDLVENLLALASLDEGRPLQVTTVDAGQILRDAALDAQAVQPTRSIALDLPPDGPNIAGDPALLTQLAGILVSNALVHTPVEAAISLSAARQETGIALVVADRGPGLDADTAAHVFDRFWRGEASRARRSGTGSTGLGLAIAKSIAEAHGGTITLTTAPGEGCTFTVRLPDR